MQAASNDWKIELFFFFLTLFRILKRALLADESLPSRRQQDSFSDKAPASIQVIGTLYVPDSRSCYLPLGKHFLLSGHDRPIDSLTMRLAIGLRH